MKAINRLTGDGYAFETITVTDTATGFGSGYRVGDHSHIRAFITASGGAMRYRYDGSDPTTSVGHTINMGDVVVIEGSVNIAQFKVIRIGDSSGTLSVTYERWYG